MSLNDLMDVDVNTVVEPILYVKLDGSLEACLPLFDPFQDEQLSALL